MTSDSAAGEAHLLKFQGLLRDLFQFDCADLDFGIYRIMNHKRDAIEKFISEQLPARIACELTRDALARQAKAAADIEEARQVILENFGRDAIDPDGDLDDKYSGTPRGRDYLRAKAAAEPGLSPQAVETAVYNHLYTFFSRYYQDGDFVSKRRYGRNQRYAIPYNGEEVYLHWANSDQYYVKTAEHFNNYDWKTPTAVSVHFRLEAANVEQDNVKGDRRFFVPLAEKTAWDADARAVTVPFEYRPLTVSESTRYGKQRQQGKIITAAVSEIPQRLPKVPEAVTALTGEHRRGGDDEPVSRLEHHLLQYTRRNDSDFFIHKDLRGFLSRELDFYLKNEVLNLDNLEAAGEGAADGWFQQMRLIKSVGGEIIDFLAQIEDFQKRLWEKRKFVVDTQYCVTLGNVDSSFHQEIVDNEAQWEEWKALLGIDGADRSKSFLKSQPTRPLDTRHFDADFTDRLLASIGDIDGMTDGLLVHSENWQALRMLDEQYRKSVKCIYIDPPYNAPSSEIIYKNGYKHSTYLSLLYDRVSFSRSLMRDDGVHTLAIDENEYERTSLLLQSILSDMKHTTVSIVHNPAGQQGQNFSPSHDYACFAYKSEGRQIGNEVRKDSPIENNFRDWGGEESKREVARNCFYPIYIRGGKISGFGAVCAPDYHPDSANMPVRSGTIAVFPIDSNGVERKWRFARSTVEGIVGELFPHFVKSRKEWDIRRRKNTFNFKTVWTDPKYFSNNHGTQLLNHILGNQSFDYPKSINTVMDCLRAGLNNQAQFTVLDYFSGSGTTGHAVINLNREDGGQRKFILVEMGEYFDTVLLPRIKKVTYSPEWRDGRPIRSATPEEAKRSPRIVKYMRLESYEDALDGIGFDEDAGRLDLDERIDGYLLKYMLNWETKQSETMLNAAKLTRPFDYHLRTHANGETRERTADVAETFNYLLGLNVRTRRVYDDDGKRYVVFRGETSDVPGRNVKVIWRETEGWTQDDFARDRQFVDEQGLVEEGDAVYVNGGSVIPGARAIEPLFKARMFSSASA